MKKTVLLLSMAAALCISQKGRAQDISTFAGNGTAGFSANGAMADTAELSSPSGVAVDNAGNVYYSDYQNNVVRKVSTSGIVTTVAGTGGYGGYNGDNIPAATAELNGPIGLAIDGAGNLYIADNANFRVRMVDTAGTITTVVGVGGTYGFGYTGDGGQATSAHIYAVSLAVDQNQNIYLADGNSTIRKITHATGIINTVAGGNNVGSTGDGNPATAAALSNPTGVAVDAAGNIYIADYNNDEIRKVDTSAAHIITKIAGTGTAGTAGNNGPAIAAQLSSPYAVTVDAAGNVYVAELGSCSIRKINTDGMISTIAGDGVCGYNGDGIPANTAKLNNPDGIALDRSGNMYIADQNNNRIRRIAGLAASTAVIPLGSKAINVYPNPVNDQLNIAGIQQNTNYRLLNITGAAVQQGGLDAGNNTLSVQNLVPGIYILEMTGANGERNVARVTKQ